MRKPLVAIILLGAGCLLILAGISVLLGRDIVWGSIILMGGAFLCLMSLSFDDRGWL